MTDRGTALLRRTVLLGVALGLLLPSAAPAAALPPAEAARAVVYGTIDAVLAVLRDASVPDAERQSRIEEIAYSRFDFATISRLVLARNWRKLTPEQREAFVEEFKRHLSLTYGRSLRDYHDQKVEVGDARVERNGDVTVRTKIVGASAQPVQVVYRLRERDGMWSVIDVVIEGVSLIQNFRAQTQEIISRDGPDHLIEVLREKNAARAAAAQP